MLGFGTVSLHRPRNEAISHRYLISGLIYYYNIKQILCRYFFLLVCFTGLLVWDSLSHNSNPASFQESSRSLTLDVSS